MRPLNEIIARRLTQALVVVGGIKSASRINGVFNVVEHPKVMIPAIPVGLSHPFVQFRHPSDAAMPARIIKSNFGVSGVETLVGKPKVAQSIVEFVLVDVVDKTCWPFSKMQGQYDRVGTDLSVKQRTCPVPDAVNRCESVLPGVPPVPDRAVVFSRLFAGCEQAGCSWKPNKPASGKINPKKLLNNIDGRKLLFHVISSFVRGIIVYDKQRGKAICVH
jgi:hypothetical protein